MYSKGHNNRPKFFVRAIAWHSGEQRYIRSIKDLENVAVLDLIHDVFTCMSGDKLVWAIQASVVVSLVIIYITSVESSKLPLFVASIELCIEMYH